MRAVLDLLSDGEWHVIEWSRDVLHLAEAEAEHIIWFLEELGLVDVDSAAGRVKMSDDFRRLPDLPIGTSQIFY